MPAALVPYIAARKPVMTLTAPSSATMKNVRPLICNTHTNMWALVTTCSQSMAVKSSLAETGTANVDLPNQDYNLLISMVA